MSNPDLTDVHDRLQDILKGQGALTRALSEQKAPVVNVTAPVAAPPKVNVESPTVNVAAPSVTVEKQKPVAWTFRITKRDARGYIESFTATPTSEQ
jgi:hypothetical protein